MVKKPDSNVARQKRHLRVRAKISGTAMRPKGTSENIATVQLGIFWERMATLSPAPIPYRLSLADISSHFFLKLP